MSDATPLPAASPHPGWLAHVPVPLFAVVMGVAGLGLAWRKAHEVLSVPEAVGEALCALSAVLFVSIAGLYAAKALRFPVETRREFDHPVRSSFFAAISISLMLLAAGAFPHWPDLARGVWLAGATLHLALTLRVLSRWLLHRHEIQHASPAWFIPVVGNIVAPILGVRLGLVEVSWFFFSVGMLFWPPLLAIVLYRLIFHEDMPPRMAPTLFVLLPPPAIGFLSWVALNGGVVDAPARMLFHAALFLTLLLLSLWRHFQKTPFAVSWWAYTFPLDAVTLAALQYATMTGAPAIAWMASALLVVSTLVVGAVLVRTVSAMLADALFVPE
ncbi:MAG: SLAC1 anion channel family protein [Alphaproteobacteria bacterium]|nr:SLAC1 anion channel family protein [Alphaproteobacteria bacterium]